MWENVARRLKIANPVIPIPTSQWLDQLQDIMNSHLTGATMDPIMDVIFDD